MQHSGPVATDTLAGEPERPAFAREGASGHSNGFRGRKAGTSHLVVRIGANVCLQGSETMHELERTGFVNRGGKGSHRNCEHPGGVRLTLSGQIGDDAKPYQEREVRRKIQESSQ